MTTVMTADSTAADSADEELTLNEWTTLTPAVVHDLHDKAFEIVHLVQDSHPSTRLTLDDFGGYGECFDGSR